MPCPFLSHVVSNLSASQAQSLSMQYARYCPAMVRTAQYVQRATMATVTGNGLAHPVTAPPAAKRCPYTGMSESGDVGFGVADKSTENFQCKKGVTLPPKGYDYEAAFSAKIEEKRRDNSYRIFARVDRDISQYPKAQFSLPQTVPQPRVAQVWCSNDYLGMSRHPHVLNAAHQALDQHGVGAGGTRNIAGNGTRHELLETVLAQQHDKDSALLFSSCFVANDATLSSLAKLLPGCHIYSDAANHASMIQGIRHSGAPKFIFRHNDVAHLRSLLEAAPVQVPKIIAFESVYSMTGNHSPMKEILDVAEEFGCLTFLDEVHAVGLYGARGAGLAEQLGLAHRVHIISGTLGKAYGAVGGYIAGSRSLVDAIRSTAPGFIFTTALPPSIVAAATAAIQHVQVTPSLRLQQRRHARSLQRQLAKNGLPVMVNASPIVPVLVGDAALCRRVAQHLAEKHYIYVQPINAPTVAVGTERLRLTPTPYHTAEMQMEMVEALKETWKSLGMPLETAASIQARLRDCDRVEKEWPIYEIVGPLLFSEKEQSFSVDAEQKTAACLRLLTCLPKATTKPSLRL